MIDYDQRIQEMSTSAKAFTLNHEHDVWDILETMSVIPKKRAQSSEGGQVWRWCMIMWSWIELRFWNAKLQASMLERVVSHTYLVNTKYMTRVMT